MRSEDVARRAEQAREEFVRQMDDDFNTAGALGAVFDLVSASNAALKEDVSGPGLGQAASVLRELLGVLGLPCERERPASGEIEERLIELLVEVRAEARQAKQFAIGDRIRDELKAMGIEIEDLSGGDSRVVRRVVREDD